MAQRLDHSILFTAILIGIGLFSPVCGISYHDGGIHDVNTVIADVVLYNSFWDEPTTLNLLNGGTISSLYARQDSRINILGGSVSVHMTEVVSQYLAVAHHVFSVMITLMSS
jgi:hypothetical protein